MKSLAFFLFVLCGAGTIAAQQATASAIHRATLRDYARTIRLLEKGIRLNWSQGQMRNAFVAVYGPGIASGQRMSACGYPVFLLLEPRQIWDEHPPFAYNAQQTLEACRSQQATFAKMAALQEKR